MAQSLGAEAWVKLAVALNACLRRVRDLVRGRGARRIAGVSSGAVRRDSGFGIGDS